MNVNLMDCRRAVDVSIVVCTHRRGERLRRSLGDVERSVGAAKVRSEIVVVENGFKDEVTESVVRATNNAVYAFLPTPGASSARNEGVRLAQGRVIAMIDDDVLVESGWLSAIVSPILDGLADLTCGSVCSAHPIDGAVVPPSARGLFEFTQRPEPFDGEMYFGAGCMAMSRDVAARIPFDTELGPGTEIHAGEDTLLYRRARALGFRARAVPGARAMHDFDPARLSAADILRAGYVSGQAQGFISWHLHHTRISMLSLRRAVDEVGYAAARRAAERGRVTSAGFESAMNVGFKRRLAIESRRPPKYALAQFPPRFGATPIAEQTSVD